MFYWPLSFIRNVDNNVVTDTVRVLKRLYKREQYPFYKNASISLSILLILIKVGTPDARALKHASCHCTPSIQGLLLTSRNRQQRTLFPFHLCLHGISNLYIPWSIDRCSRISRTAVYKGKNPSCIKLL